MMTNPDCPIIALEEHYWDAELLKHYATTEAPRGGPMEERLLDIAGVRIREMDEAGIDVQVLSHGAPSAQNLPRETAAAVTSKTNDRLARIVAQHPARFAAFGALPTAVPEAAADELERVVTQHGFKGTMLHGTANGEFLDHQKFWPIYARAEKLDVPIYFHPASPNKTVNEIYYQDYVKDFPLVARPAWGYTVETATLAIRLILSGVFERHPNLKVMLGHFGETLPFLLWRVHAALDRPGGKRVDFRGIFSRNFYVTTSGFFSTPALLCTMMEMGIDHVLFAVDWPFVIDNKPAVEWMKGAPISAEDKAKILSGNAKRLLRM